MFRRRPERISAPRAVAHDGNHGTGRDLSGATDGGVTEADGFLFASRYIGDS